MVIYELFKYLFDYVDSRNAIHTSTSHAHIASVCGFPSDINNRNVALLQSVYSLIGLNKMVYFLRLQRVLLNPEIHITLIAFDYFLAIDHTTIHVPDSTNGLLCRFTRGANHRTDSGCLKFEMKDVIWVSLHLFESRSRSNVASQRFRFDSTAVSQLTKILIYAKHSNKFQCRKSHSFEKEIAFLAKYDIHILSILLLSQILFIAFHL